jgi:acetolactate synthase-1/2/3 large subunit
MQQPIVPFSADIDPPSGVFPKAAPLPCPPITTARAVLEAFARRGVSAAFGIPGGLASPLFDALAETPEIRLVSTRHEGMAAYAAMGSALATGLPALVMTTSGPGITNAITGIAAAHVENLPLVFLAGEVSAGSASRGAIQDSTSNGIDAVAMMRTITRWSARVDSSAGALAAVEHAMAMATGKRPGPVFLSIPVDTGKVLLRPAPMSVGAPEPPPRADRAACAEIAARLAGARRPLFVLGNGAREAAAEVRMLAERLSIPVVTTPHAKGVFPESHRLHLGGIGLGQHPSVSAYLRGGPDVTVIVGSRLGDYSTNGWTVPLAGSEATIQIDHEAWLIGRNYPVTLGVVADARAALRGVLAALPHDIARPRRDVRGIVRTRPESAFSDAVPLKQPRVLRALQEAFPDAIFTADQGEHCAFAVHYLSIDRPDGFRSMVGLASMGTGFGIGIGLRHARRDRPVVCISGDGGFAMHAGEILTCVEHGIDVVLVVMNDGRWNMVHHGFSSIFGRVPDEFPGRVANLAGVAESFGAIGVVIEAPEDLNPALLRALAGRGRPVLLDVRIDPDDALSIESRIASVKSFTEGDAR